MDVGAAPTRAAVSGCTPTVECSAVIGGQRALAAHVDQDELARHDRHGRPLATAFSSTAAGGSLGEHSSGTGGGGGSQTAGGAGGIGNFGDGIVGSRGVGGGGGGGCTDRNNGGGGGGGYYGGGGGGGGCYGNGGGGGGGSDYAAAFTANAVATGPTLGTGTVLITPIPGGKPPPPPPPPTASLALVPSADTGSTSTTHTVIVTVGLGLGTPPVRFTVASGPNAGATGTCQPATCSPDSNSQVAWTYRSGGRDGTDFIQAYVDQNNNRSVDLGEPQANGTMAWVTGFGRYVALGDSYAAGEGASNPSDPGTGRFEPQTAAVNVDECHRSYDSYSRLLSADPGLPKPPAGQDVFRACSGATIEDLYKPAHKADSGWRSSPTMVPEPPQLSFVTTDTTLATIGIGGNDVGFGDLIPACITRSIAIQSPFLLRPHPASPIQTKLAGQTISSCWSGSVH